MDNRYKLDGWINLQKCVRLGIVFISLPVYSPGVLLWISYLFPNFFLDVSICIFYINKKGNTCEILIKTFNLA